MLLGRPRLAQLAVHLPRHPQQQHPAGQGQPDDHEQPGGKIGEQDAQHRGGGDAEHDRPPALLGRQPGRRHPDDDRVVAGEHHVDDDHRQQRAELINLDQHLRHISTARSKVEMPVDAG